MPDYTVKADVDSMLRADNDAGIRTAIGLGQTDAPTFLAASLTGQSLTGTQATSLVDLATTWLSTTGTPTAIKMNVIDTANVPTASLLMDLQVGGVSKFSVRKDGLVALTSINLGGGAYGGDANWFSVAGLNLSSSSYLSFGAADIRVYRDAAGILAQRNGTAAQTFRVYDSYDTAGTNYERATFGFPTGTNTLRIGTEQAGTGASQPIDFVTGGVVRMTIQSGGNISIPNGLFVTGNIVAGYLLKLTALTVATLPAAASNAFPALVGVSDATMTAALGKGTTVVGGGANKVIVMSDGTNWVIL